jgi:hypothetical protein
MRLSKPILAALLLGVALHAALPGRAQTPAGATAGPSAAELFKDADIAVGEKLIVEHKCTECHVRRVGGDGSAMYRPAGRINTPSALRGMVDYCSTELNLGLFPEDVTAVAAVLQRDHYRFGLPRPPASPARR